MPQQVSRAAVFLLLCAPLPGATIPSFPCATPPPQWLALLLVLAASLRAAAPFPQDGSDLQPDPAATFGSLPNGLRYVVMPNHEPKGRASLRLLVLAGLASRRTRTSAASRTSSSTWPSTGAPTTPRAPWSRSSSASGWASAADTNASTSFDRTLYQLELPDTAPATLAEGLQILADYGGGLLLKQEMVDKERGIILSEKRTRDSVRLPHLRRPDGLHGGGHARSRAPADRPRRRHREVQPRPVRRLLRHLVPPRASWSSSSSATSTPRPSRSRSWTASPASQARSPEPAPVDLGRVQDFNRRQGPLPRGARGRRHPRSRSARPTPYAREPDTAARQLKHLPRDLATRDAQPQALDILAKKENAPVHRARAPGVDEAFGLYRESDIEVTCKADQWTAAIGVADQELRRALQFGFRPDELKEAVADFRNEPRAGGQDAPPPGAPRTSRARSPTASSTGRCSPSPADDLAALRPGPGQGHDRRAALALAAQAPGPSPGRYVYRLGQREDRGRRGRRGRRGLREVARGRREAVGRAGRRSPGPTPTSGPPARSPAAPTSTTSTSRRSSSRTACA